MENRIKYKRNNGIKLVGLVAQLDVRGKKQGVLIADSNISSLEESVDGNSIEQGRREQRGHWFSQERGGVSFQWNSWDGK